MSWHNSISSFTAFSPRLLSTSAGMLSIPSVLLLFISLMAARTSSLRISGPRSSLTSFVNSSVISMGLFLLQYRSSTYSFHHPLTSLGSCSSTPSLYSVPQFPYLMSFCLSSFSLFHTLCRIFPFSAFPLALDIVLPTTALLLFPLFFLTYCLISCIPVCPFLYFDVSTFFFLPYPVSFPLSPKACGEVVLSGIPQQPLSPSEWPPLKLSIVPLLCLPFSSLCCLQFSVIVRLLSPLDFLYPIFSYVGF